MGTKGRRFHAVALAAAIGAAVAAPAAQAAVPTGHNPRGLPVASCFWTGPFTRDNPDTNYAFPGTQISYWGAKFLTPPGATLTLEGRYPHSRYYSLNAYAQDGEATSSLPDVAIKPDKGSTNPFKAGADRDARKRDYTVRVLGTDPPGDPVRNTLYAPPDMSFSTYQDIILRIYAHDRGTGLTGGVGLPTPELRLADGTVLRGQALCDELNSNHDYYPQLLPQPLYDSLVNWPGKDPATNPGQDPLRFEKYFNLNLSLASYKTEAEFLATDATPAGTQYNNNDVNYMTAGFSFAFGEVLAVHGRMPTTPRTFKGVGVMGKGQLRHWDMCVIESLVTTNTWDCTYDELMALNKRRGRRYVLAIAPAADRPSNAKRKCGVAWLSANPEGDGAGRPDTGLLLHRDLLPAKDFEQTAWNMTEPRTAASVMGPFYPEGDYFSKAEFESHGCPFRWSEGKQRK